MFRTFDPKNIPTKELHEVLLGCVAPRPIAWASTVDKEGNVNLSPFSFFNIFGSRPPVAIFCPSRRVRDNTTKHTLMNVEETKECVINIANYDIARQMVLSSTEYPEDVNEFEKAGLTMAPSVMVKPPRVFESPAQLECRVKEVIHMGTEGGAGNLILCEVVYIHVNEDVLNEKGVIDPLKIDQVARLGGIWYTRANKGLFQIPNPGVKLNIGFDGLPEHILRSKYLTGNELAMLASVEKLPEPEEIEAEKNSTHIKTLEHKCGGDARLFDDEIHQLAKFLLSEDKTDEAWRVLLAGRTVSSYLT